MGVMMLGRVPASDSGMMCSVRLRMLVWCLSFVLTWVEMMVSNSVKDCRLTVMSMLRCFIRPRYASVVAGPARKLLWSIV